MADKALYVVGQKRFVQTMRQWTKEYERFIKKTMEQVKGA